MPLTDELERERDELAALVNEWRRGVYLVDGWNQAQAERNISDEDEWLRLLGEWASEHASDRRPDVSLARRDARMKAEVLESLNAHDLSRYAKSIGADAWEMNPVGICKLFNQMAGHYRNQAKEQS